MTHAATARATAFTLSALVTLALMAGIQGLADPGRASTDLLAAAPAEVQTVVITGQRLPRS